MATAGGSVKLPGDEELRARATELLAAWRVADVAVTADWNPRLVTTAGRAFVRRGHIELNPTLLARAPGELAAVLAHEAAHIAAFRLYGGRIPAHGRHWRALMRLAGHAPEVSHRIRVDDLRARRRLVFLRICTTCGDRLLQAAVRYGRCRTCGRRDGFAVWKAPATAAGRAALARLGGGTGRPDPD